MIAKILSQPYPLYRELKPKILFAFGFGVFVGLFLYFFRPFGIYALPHQELLTVVFHIGCICTAVLLFDLLVLPEFIPAFLDDIGWTVRKEICYILWNIVSIAIANTLYSAFYLEFGFSSAKFLLYLVATFAIAILPVTIHVLIKNTVLLKRNLKEAHHISSSLNHKKRLLSTPNVTLTIDSENKHENFTIRASDLLYITSADNYIEIFYIDNNSIKTQLIRTTLKAARDDLHAFTAFYRCHRGWIVNLDHVISLTGNSQGYRLILNHTEVTIPVSRNLNEEITIRLSK